MARDSIPRGAIAEVTMRRWSAAGERAEPDRLAVEAPLEIRLGGRAVSVLLRTPGDDEELVTGFLVSEGIVRRAAEVIALVRPDSPVAEERANVLDVELAAERHPPLADRFFWASAGCGVCGKSSIAALAFDAPAVASTLAVSRAVLAVLPERLRATQSVFEATGGLHAAGLFTAAGALLAAREDIGRHNAVDKLVGWAARSGRLPLGDTVLQVSGRLGYEIVQKAIVAGVPVVAAVGAASSLAVDLATRYGVTLAAFVRPDRINVYGDPARVTA